MDDNTVAVPDVANTMESRKRSFDNLDKDTTMTDAVTITTADGNVASSTTTARSNNETEDGEILAGPDHVSSNSKRTRRTTDQDSEADKARGKRMFNMIQGTLLARPPRRQNRSLLNTTGHSAEQQVGGSTENDGGATLDHADSSSFHSIHAAPLVNSKISIQEQIQERIREKLRREREMFEEKKGEELNERIAKTGNRIRDRAWELLAHWKQRDERQAQFLVTATKPEIRYLPKIHTDLTQQRLQAQQNRLRREQRQAILQEALEATSLSSSSIHSRSSSSSKRSIRETIQKAIRMAQMEIVDPRAFSTQAQSRLKQFLETQVDLRLDQEAKEAKDEEEVEEREKLNLKGVHGMQDVNVGDDETANEVHAEEIGDSEMEVQSSLTFQVADSEIAVQEAKPTTATSENTERLSSPSAANTNGTSDVMLDTEMA